MELGPLAGKSGLVLGAGKMATLAGKLLRAAGVRTLMFVNRTSHRAETLARETGGVALPIAELDRAIAEADIVIGAVLVEEPLVTAEHIRPRSAPLLIVDLGVPRTVDPECGLLPGVTVRDVDALEPVAHETRRRFQGEVNKVEVLVGGAVADFGVWMRSRSGAQAITDVRAHAAAIQQSELERALRRLSHLSERDQNVVRSLADGIVNKMVHGPVVALRTTESNDEIDRIRDILGVNRR